MQAHTEMLGEIDYVLFWNHLLRKWATIDKSDSWLSDCSASLHMIPTEHIPSKARSTLCILDLLLEPDRVILSCIIQGSKGDLEKIHQQEK